MQATKRSAAGRPYPGLRSFEASEASLFHGRERQIEELLRRLSQNRFLAVVGSSGSGKSSVVRAGLLPALYRGYLSGATTRWRIAVMHPGSAPLAELAKALARPDVFGKSDVDQLRESSFGIVNAVRAGALANGESLLIVVDQFEELFRFRRESVDRDGGAEAALFVSQLLQASEEFGSAIYVVITMRSDFLGECAQFPGLPEALNKGQYLIPRMTREQRREAITASLDLFDASMSDRLVQRLLNDAGDDPDQLSVLQHALQQTYAIWEREGRRGDIDFKHYESAGTMESALHRHAQRVHESMGENAWLCERIFRCLTVDENGRAVRRPAKLKRILRVVGVADDRLYAPEVQRIIKVLAAPENCFLRWSTTDDSDPPLELDSVIDISHESLIRKWTTLERWVRDEAKCADIYRYLRRDASLYPRDAGLWDDPDLAGALRSQQAIGWNEDWAEQYGTSTGASYSKVQEFLQLSVKDRHRKLRREALFRRLKVAIVLLAVAVIGIATKLYLSQAENRKVAATQAQLVKDKTALEDSQRKAEERVRSLEAEIKERAASTDAKSIAEIEVLRKQLVAANASAQQRKDLIKANESAVKLQRDYSDSLSQVRDLQAQLKKAWDERDQARYELQKVSVPDQKQQRAK
jgi:hypothetical protein